MPVYVNPGWADIVTTTRDNRSVEHGSLFTKEDPSKHHHKSPVHPILPKDYKGIGKYPIMKSKRPRHW